MSDFELASKQSDGIFFVFLWMNLATFLSENAEL